MGGETKRTAPAARVALFAAVGAAALGTFAVVVSSAPPIEVLGGDGIRYAVMAEHPLDAVEPGPYAQRIAVPLLVSVLPFETESGFTLIAVLSMLVASLFAGLIARHFGLSLLAQATAAALVAGSYIGVYAVYNPYLVDPALLAVSSGVIWLGLRRRFVLATVVLMLGVTVKEAAATLIVLPYLLDPDRRGRLDLKSLRRAAAYATPVLLVFVAVHLLVPTGGAEGEDLRLTFFEFDVFGRGLLVSAVNPIVALFGATVLLWPLGVVMGSADVRRLHVWVLLATPVLLFGHWERTLGIFVPVAIVSALVALRAASSTVILAFAAGSFWVTGIVGALTIGEGESSLSTKVGLSVPGLVLALLALLWFALKDRPKALPPRQPARA